MGKDGARLLGFVLLILGIISLAYSGITYTRREKVVDLGPIQVESKTKERIPLPPILGGIALAGGLVLLLSSSRRTS